MVFNSDYGQRQTDLGIVVWTIIGYFGQLVRGPHKDYGPYHEWEVYFEAPEFSEGVGYMISYGGDKVEEESEA